MHSVEIKKMKRILEIGRDKPNYDHAAAISIVLRLN